MDRTKLIELLYKFRDGFYEYVDTFDNDNVMKDFVYFPTKTDDIYPVICYWLLQYVKDVNQLKESLGNLVDFVIKKNRDYGCSVYTQPYLASDVSIRDAILVRLSDKRNRYISLTTNMNEGGVPNYESLQDTYLDIVGYYLLLWCWDNKEEKE